MSIVEGKILILLHVCIKHQMLNQFYIMAKYLIFNLNKFSCVGSPDIRASATAKATVAAFAASEGHAHPR